MAGGARLPPIEVLNELPAADFAAAMAPLFEGAPSYLVRLAAARPFATHADLWPRALTVARAMPEADQLELINAHPRLGAPPASVSALSFQEQGYDREPTLGETPGTVGETPGTVSETPGVAADAVHLAAELERLNAAYEARFGFRFCVFVNGRPRAALVPVIVAALGADRATEIRRALGDVVAIAADRARGSAR